MVCLFTVKSFNGLCSYKLVHIQVLTLQYISAQLCYSIIPPCFVYLLCKTEQIW